MAGCTFSGALRVSPVPADYVRGEAHGTRTRGWADRPDRRLGRGGGGALVAASDWEPITLFLLLLALSVVSELFRLETANLHISATFLSVVLAMTLLGPTPAAVLGVTTYLINALNGPRLVAGDARERLDLRVLPAGRRPAVRGARRPGRCEDDLAAFILARARRLPVDERPQLPADRDRHRGRRRAAGAPQLPGRSTSRSRPSSWRSACSPPASPSPSRAADLARRRPAGGRRADLPVPAPHLAQLTGPQGEARAPHPRARLAPGRPAEHGPADALAARQDDGPSLGRRRALLARDRPPMGLDEHDQDIVHTAALLHDIGKFIFPDSILLADSKLTDEEYELVKRHPEQGARLVAQIEGYGPGRRDRPRAPRADRRQGLPERPRRPADPARGEDHLGRRHVRRDDLARQLPPAGLLARGDRGAAPGLGRAARRRRGGDVHRPAGGADDHVPPRRRRGLRDASSTSRRACGCTRRRARSRRRRLFDPDRRREGRYLARTTTSA